MMKFFSFLNGHKTKITGILLIGIGSLQANASFMQTLLPPRQYAFFTIGAGALVAMLGFLNNKPPTGDK